MTAPARSPLVYSNTAIYQAVMRVLYGRHFRARYEAIAREIPDGSSVVDVCAGDCYLYRNYLKRKSVSYIALDVSRPFVDAAQRRGIDAREFNMKADTLPLADYVVMQGSLFYFMPDTEAALNKLIGAARRYAIVGEPVRNLSDSKNPLLAAISRRSTRAASEAEGAAGDRFNKETLSVLFQANPRLERMFPIPGGREMVGIFRGTAD